MYSNLPVSKRPHNRARSPLRKWVSSLPETDPVLPWKPRSWEMLQSRSKGGTGLPRKQVKKPLMHQAATRPHEFYIIKQVRYSPTVGHLESKKGLSTMNVPSYHECTFLIESEGCSVLSISLGPHGLWILQARILEWVAFPFFRGSSQPRDWTRSPILQADSLPAEPQGSPRTLEWVTYPFFSRSSQPRNRTGVSYIAGGFFTNWAMREAPF